MIVNVRGTHGSGKSTVAREVMRAGKAEPIFGLLGWRRPEAYQLTLPGVATPVFVIGPYQTACGGCDALPDNATVIALAEQYAARGHVLFEGSLISSCYGAVGAFLERFGWNAALLFLDTPLEECLRRVEARRGRARDERLIRNVTSKFESGWRTYERVVRDGKMRRIIASSEDSPRVILAALAALQGASEIVGALRPPSDLKAHERAA